MDAKPRLETRDRGGPYLPITLQFASRPFVQHIRSLLQDWNTDDGVRQRLVGHPDLLCVHVERWTGTDDGFTYADNVSMWESDVVCPFFNGPMDVEWRP